MRALPACGQARRAGLTAWPPRGLLVETLQGRDRAARERLWELMRPALERLLERLIAEHRLVGQHDRLVLHALHTAETWLRTQPLPAFDQVSWQAFHGDRAGPRGQDGGQSLRPGVRGQGSGVRETNFADP